MIKIVVLIIFVVLGGSIIFSLMDAEGLIASISNVFSIVGAAFEEVIPSVGDVFDTIMSTQYLSVVVTVLIGFVVLKYLISFFGLWGDK